MAWTSPMTFVANATLTAAQLNAHLRDNLNETAPAKATTAGGYFVTTTLNAIAERVPELDYIATSETTTSTSFTNLATPGPSVSVTTGPRALILWKAQVGNDTSGANSYMSYEVSGATTAGATDGTSIMHRGQANSSANIGGWDFLEGLTGGTNTFTAVYKVSSGTGTFIYRRILVLPY